WKSLDRSKLLDESTGIFEIEFVHSILVGIVPSFQLDILPTTVVFVSFKMKSTNCMTFSSIAGKRCHDLFLSRSLPSRMKVNRPSFSVVSLRLHHQHCLGIVKAL